MIKNKIIISGRTYKPLKFEIDYKIKNFKVLEQLKDSHDRVNQLWKLECVCGTTITATGLEIVSLRGSCGCLRYENSKGEHNKKAPGLSGLNKLLRTYKMSAKKGNKEWNLTNSQCEILFKGRCHYCNDLPSKQAICNNSKNPDSIRHSSYIYNGIDRKDSSVGYLIENVVSCCNQCNIAKMDVPYEMFIQWIQKVYKNLNTKGNY